MAGAAAIAIIAAVMMFFIVALRFDFRGINASAVASVNLGRSSASYTEQETLVG